MDIPALLDTLKTHGISVTVSGDRIKLVPGSRVPEEVAETLRAHKAEVLEYLREEVAQVQVDLSALGLKVNEPRIPNNPDLLAWAVELAEQELVLPERVSYVEAPLRIITTEQVSRYAAIYVNTISYARLNQRTGGWGRFTPEWFKKQEEEAIGALMALRDALERHQGDKAKING